MSIKIELIKKDFSLLKRQLLSYSALALIAIVIMFVPHQSVSVLGTIALIFVMVSFYCHIVMKAVVIERKEKNHLFLANLPVSARTLALTKVTTVVLIFLCLWAAAFALVFCLSINIAYLPGAAPANYALYFMCFPPAFALLLAAAVGFYSEGVATLAMVASNMLIVVLLNYIPNSPFMSAAFSAGSIAEVGLLWPTPINTILLLQLSFFAILIAFCYGVCDRRRNLAD